MRPQKIDPLIAVLGASLALICAAVAWLAISERRITLGSRHGISYSEGLDAVIQGWLFVGAALTVVGILASLSRWKRLIWIALFALWVAAVAIYFVFWY